MMNHASGIRAPSLPGHHHPKAEVHRVFFLLGWAISPHRLQRLGEGGTERWGTITSVKDFVLPLVLENDPRNSTRRRQYTIQT